MTVNFGPRLDLEIFVSLLPHHLTLLIRSTVAAAAGDNDLYGIPMTHPQLGRLDSFTIESFFQPPLTNTDISPR